MRRYFSRGVKKTSSSVTRITWSIVEALEPRIVLSAAYSNSDLFGNWTLNGMDVAGSVQFDGKGAVTGGSFVHGDGSLETPSGTYTVSENGGFSVTGGAMGNTSTGAFNSSKDVVALTDPTSPNQFGVAINSQSGGFTNAALQGTWSVYANGDFAPDVPPNFLDNSGHGTVTFDGKGNLSGSFTADESGKTNPVSGTYSVTPAGTFTFTITGQVVGKPPLSFTGAVNNSQDVIAADATNLPQAATTNDSRMVVLLRASGAYSVADLNGTWQLSADGQSGTISFDGAGNLTGSRPPLGLGGGETDVGTYTVDANGAVTMSIMQSFSMGGTGMINVAGSLNASRNILAVDSPNAGTQGLDDLNILVNSAPTLQTTVSLQSSSYSIMPGDKVTLTAKVVPVLPTGIVPTGNIAFFDGATLIDNESPDSTGTVSFQTSALGLGNHVITASFTGDSSFIGGAKNTTSILVSVPPMIGGLDSSFGNQGVATHNVGFTSTNDALLQSDGKSVIIGTAGAAGLESFGVTRYNTDGSLDSGFGTNGVVYAMFGATDDQAAAAALLPNGDILVAGTATTFVNNVATGSQFALAEFTSAGMLDPAFGNGAGYVLTSFSNTPGVLSNDVARAIAVAPSGEIFVAGSSDAAGKKQDFAVAAYNPNGTPATSFRSSGLATFDFLAGDDSIASIALQTNGDVVAAGSASDANGVGSVALARFLPNGALDTRFGVNGTVDTAVGGVDDEAASVALDSKGRIVVGGFTATGSEAAGNLSANFLVIRYTDAGKLDRSFGNGGVVTTSFNQPAAITRVLIDPDGTILASGKTTASLSTVNPTELDIAIARYTDNGQSDTTFNVTGQAIFGLGTPGVTSSLTALTLPNEQGASIKTLGVIPFDTTTTLFHQLKVLTQISMGIVVPAPNGKAFIVGIHDSDTAEVSVVASGTDLQTSVATTLPASVVGGTKGKATIQIADMGNIAAAGAVTIQLFVELTPSIPSGEIPFQTIPEKLKLKTAQSKTFRIKFLLPSSIADGAYYLLAKVDAGSLQDLNPTNNSAATATPVMINKPFVDLSGSALATPIFKSGKPTTVSFVVTNDGNVPAKAVSAVELFASSTGVLTGATALATDALHVLIKPGASKTFKVRVAPPATLPAGSYFLLADLDPSNIFLDSNTANNLLVSAGTFTL